MHFGFVMNISIDRGGTFTDVYAEINSKPYVFKLLSVDPQNYEDAPTEGIRRVLEVARSIKISKNTKLDLSDVNSIRMGTTVATNALLERKGAKVALITTSGFKDILKLGQQARPDIFDLKVRKLSQLYDQVVEVNERLIEDLNGELKGVSGARYSARRSPDLEEIKLQLTKLKSNGCNSVAIAFMHAYDCPLHELQVEKLAIELGFQTSTSHKLQPMIKLVSRANSVVADAYLSPIIQQYLNQIANGFVGGLDSLNDKLLFMQSDGGLAPASRFSGLKSILSGPAGGVVGYARTSFVSKPVLGFDMGGTSTDVSRYDGEFEHVFETSTAEVTILAPQLPIETVAAGGGSILSFKNGLYCVGPESAGAHPGPACYRKGGPLTVTDANIVCGRIDVFTFPRIFGPNEDQPLDHNASFDKFEQLALEIFRYYNIKRLPDIKDIKDIALGFLKVATETMCRPIRSLSEGKGHTTSSHVLASFGGAAGQHAVDIARNLNISEVVIHKYSSVLSAFGISLADVVSDVQLPVSCELTFDEIDNLRSKLEDLERSAVSKFGPNANCRVERFLNCRYVGSDSFMMIRESGEDVDQLRKLFVEKHRTEFGFTLERKILVGDVRVRALLETVADSSKLVPGKLEFEVQPPTPKRTWPIKFSDGHIHPSQIYNLNDLPTNTVVWGPAMILDNTQTLVVPPQVKAEIHPQHVILKLPETELQTEASDAVDPVKLSVFAHRFMSIAEQMGHTLQKTSISVNIKERLDFSCAIFDPDGGLVANAPHIPVHLGSMGSAVGYQRDFWKNNLKPGDVLMANHPAYGGSHLPDITVITPVFDNGEIIFWVASRGHHSDIGGITAGSMPPFSQKLWQEGACIQAFKIVSEGKFDLDNLTRLMVVEPAKYPNCSGSRSFSDSVSDLKAQIAANNKGILLLNALADNFGLHVVQKYMRAIQDNAEQSVRNLLKQHASKVGAPYILQSCDFLDDGSKIALKITINPESGSTVFDFSGTSPQLKGNLNAPKAITYSAILYCLRTMISEDIPLNQGCLKPIKLKIDEGTMLSPGPDAATVGGNVETSQRITDTIFKAFQVVADSQGTCNNLSFGCDDFGYYETIGGGAGAGPDFHGQSGVQVHMTNTRSTDPEVFEKRYPVILNTFSIRQNSGGDGKFKGGDGIVRDIEFLRPVQLSILSERRDRQPNGICGGLNGKPGKNIIIRNGKSEVIGGKHTVQLNAGDRVQIRTPGGGGYGKPDTH